MKKYRVLFYSSVKSVDLFKIQRFYQIDIKILQDLGYDVIVTNRISDSLKYWKYDILFSYFYRFSFFPSLIAKCFAKRTYFTGGIDDLDESFASSKRYFIQKLFFKLCYWVSDSCIIVSYSDAANISKFFKYKKKLSFSEHAIDVGAFSSNITKEPIFTTIVWMGEEDNVKRKGVDTSLLVFSRLKHFDRYKNYKFVIIGRKGDGSDFIETLIDKYQLNDSVILTGEVSEEEKIAMLKQSEYYFQLSLYEGFGLSSLEALCAGCVVIHSGKGGLANPAYAEQILFNIDNDFDSEYEKLLNQLQSISLNDLPRNLDYFDIERRKNDFSRILECEK